MTTRLPTLLLPLLLVACYDDKPSITPDAAPPDAPTTGPRAVSVAGTFVPGEPGVMSALDLASLEVAERVAPTGAVAEDPMIRHIGDELFVVNRGSGNNVTILDATTFAVKEQIATGAGSNPQDIAVVGDKLYVPAFGTAGVVVLRRGTTTISTIDLSSLDPDGQPNCISAFRVDADIYVACELLDESFQAREPGVVVVIDSATDQVRTMVTLANLNPFGVFERMPAEAGGDLVIPTVPDFVDFSTGCIERITPGETPAAAGCVVSNQALDGFAASVDFQMLGSTPMLWAIVSKFDSEARGNLQGYDLAIDELWPEPISPPAQVLVDVAICPDSVVVADQAMAANGLRVYRNGLEVTTAPLSVGLRPSANRGLVCL
jgi:hypothetical protein